MSIQINCDEKDIEDFLCTDNNLEKHLGLKYINRQVPISKFFMDILAYSKTEKCFYIIELKKGDLNSKAFTQAFKYAKLMALKYKNKHKIKILLIGENLNEDLYYCVKNYNIFDSLTDNYYFYTLFHYSFTNGISFNYHNIQQYKIQEMLEDAECLKDL